MKRIFTSLVGVSLLSLTFLSCSKDGPGEMARQAAGPQVITATVPAGQAYTFNLGAGSAASIKTQALHYAISEIATVGNGNKVYSYIAAKGYTGADEVTLQQTVTSHSGGCGNNYHSDGQPTTAVRTIVLRMNVAN